MPHPRYGGPRQVVRAALCALDTAPLSLRRASAIVTTPPLGPSIRHYANAAAIIETDLGPDALLAHLKDIEQRFGRRAGGQRWRARPLDLDILLWSKGAFVAPHLAIPHPEMAHRRFVLAPLRTIAPDWRHPLTVLTVQHMAARLDQKRPAA
ncbi:MAG: 2-amino-4-hydroxy-6-hydroxymethyldihydropteridine diphosphokinase [Pseudomonadota bacterium]